MDSEVVKGSETRTEGSFKRTGDELESDISKKQKIDEHVEAEKDDDQEEAEMKKHMEIVQDDEIAIDAIPLATKSLVIVEYTIVKEGKMGYFQLIRVDGSSKRYSSMIQMLQNIDREDLETLWKLVKAKHGNTRPEEEYERVLWGDLKVMFEPDIKSEVWRNLQGYKVTIWKLFDSCRLSWIYSLQLSLLKAKQDLFKWDQQETPSPSSSPASSPTLPIRKRYRGTSKPILDTRTEDDELEAEGISSRSEESEDEGLGYVAARRRALELAADPMPSRFEVDPKDGTVYIDIEFDAPPVRALVQTPTSPEWSSGSLPVSPATLNIPSPIASLVTTLAATIAVDEDEFIEVGAQLELYESVLHDHTQRLDAFPPIVLEGIGRDITELYDRSVAVRGEIYSQRFRLRSLKRG
ncbi:hypothetical protein Tco_1370499 [Tanacetum coccineum]